MAEKKDSTKQRKRTAELLLTCLLLFCTNAAGQNPLIYAAERSSISVNKTAERSSIKGNKTMERSSTDGTKAAGADTADGIYTIQGKLWKADEDRASMGNASLTGDSTSQIALFRIRKSGDSTLLQLEFHPLTAVWNFIR